MDWPLTVDFFYQAIADCDEDNDDDCSSDDDDDDDDDDQLC